MRLKFQGPRLNDKLIRHQVTKTNSTPQRHSEIQAPPVWFPEDLGVTLGRPPMPHLTACIWSVKEEGEGPGDWVRSCMFRSQTTALSRVSGDTEAWALSGSRGAGGREGSVCPTTEQTSRPHPGGSGAEKQRMLWPHLGEGSRPRSPTHLPFSPRVLPSCPRW